MTRKNYNTLLSLYILYRKIYTVSKLYHTCHWATWPHDCRGNRRGGLEPGPSLILSRQQGTRTQTPSGASAAAPSGCPSLGKVLFWRRCNPTPPSSSARAWGEEILYHFFTNFCSSSIVCVWRDIQTVSNNIFHVILVLNSSWTQLLWIVKAIARSKKLNGGLKRLQMEDKYMKRWQSAVGR